MMDWGINAYHGDASAALFRDNRLPAALQQERFTRLEHAADFLNSAAGLRLVSTPRTPSQRASSAAAHVLGPPARWSASLPRRSTARRSSKQTILSVAGQTYPHIEYIVSRRRLDG